ncbi:LLM class flavin-dependent oxidoreductase [Streptomyces sp. 16-176A]|uniref:LLM class flavin-dependent oxidoreductase n=1 Tax=Streptomyces sp. 16-176A TaxID=2530458 RepID=UPI00345C837D
MTAPHGRPLLHLAADIGGQQAYDAGPHVEAARLAESGRLDFVTLDDSFARPGPDALTVLSRAAPATHRIGLVPTVTTTHTEPFQVQAAVATLDWLSRGRAGWRIEVSPTEGEARLFGRRHAATAEELWQEAAEVAEAAERLWDSWEEESAGGRGPVEARRPAERRPADGRRPGDRPSGGPYGDGLYDDGLSGGGPYDDGGPYDAGSAGDGRSGDGRPGDRLSGGRSGGDRSAGDGRSGDGPYDGRSAGGGPSGDRLSGGRPSGGHSVGGRVVGGERLHQVDFTSGTFSVRGPSAVPRPPQGHPVRVVDATEGHARATAARYADVVLVRAASPAQAAALRDQLRTAAAGFGRDPDTLRVLASLVVDLGDGEYAAERGHGGGGPRPSDRGPLYRGGPVDLAELIAAWHRAGAVDGFHLVPTAPHRDLERLVNGTVALLQHRGLFRTFYPGSTLREHLGLPRPANRYAQAGGAA